MTALYNYINIIPAFDGTEFPAFDCSTVSGCDQLVVGLTHACGRILDLLMTDVPNLIQVAVVAPIGNSDHSPLLALISMAQTVPNLCVNRKHQVNFPGTPSKLEYSLWCNAGSALA